MVFDRSQHAMAFDRLNVEKVFDWLEINGRSNPMLKKPLIGLKSMAFDRSDIEGAFDWL